MLSLLTLFSLLTCFTGTAADSSSEDTAECGVYLAQSTIPNAGFGMFAGRPYRKSEEVLDGDLAVPLEEIEWNNGHADNWQFVWDDYTWSSSAFTHAEEEADNDDDVSVCSFGVGAAMNSLLPLVSVTDNHISSNYAGLHRSKDPGAGAFSPYHNRKSLATRDIQQGEELFVSYGSNYFETRPKFYGYIPLEDDYDVADTIVHKYLELEKKMFESDTILTVSETSAKEKLMASLWDLAANKLNVKKDSRVLNALPKNVSQIGYVAEKGTAYLDYNRSFHSIEWLKENGKCMDNMRPGLSTIPQAGRGAFASRFIPKGGLVGPAPLIHIPENHRFNMYDPLPEKDEKVDRNLEKGVVHKQLMLNYCFGHRNSTMLLSSYGVMTNLINHSSKNPNARIVWSDMSPHPEWMNLTVEELAKKSFAGLMLDYISLRDIMEGEEILIDYGIEWETAWNEYVKNWKPVKNAQRYSSGMELTNDPDATFWLSNEYPYYPGTVDIWIHDAYMKIAGVSFKGSADLEYHLARIVGRYKNEKGNWRYNVEIIQRPDIKERNYSTERLLGFVFDLPGDAFYFEDAPYSRDHQVHSAFRHSMMIPDDIMPEAWKNVN